MIASLSLGLSQTASAQNNGNGPPTVDVNIVSSDSPIQVEIPTPLDTTVVSMPDVTVGNTVDVNVVGGIKSSVEYRQDEKCLSGLHSDGEGKCHFSVPAGKVLRIEKVTGQVFGPKLKYVTVANVSGKQIYLIPKILKVRDFERVYEADSAGYAVDTNAFINYGGQVRDIVVTLYLDEDDGGGYSCSTSGRLFDAPSP